MSAILSLMPFIIPQYFDNNGNILAGGLLYSYIGGQAMDMFQATYQDPNGTTVYSNPIVLNASGRPTATDGTPNVIWLTPGLTYKFVLTDSLGNVIWEQDDVLANGNTFGTSFYSVGTIAQLKALTSHNDGDLAYMGGLTFSSVNVNGNDGTNGWFFFENTSSAVDDSATIVQPSNVVGSGRWLRIITDVINVKWFGALGNNSHNDSGNFSTAAALAATKNLPLWIPAGTYKLTTDPGLSGILTKFHENAIIVLNGYTMLICPEINDIKQHFNIVASSSLVQFIDYANTLNRDIYPEWWGALGDGINDDYQYIQAAIAAGSTGTPGNLYDSNFNIILTSKKSYKITNRLIIYSNICIRGAVPVQNKSLVTFNNFAGSRLIQYGSTDIFYDSFGTVVNFTLKDLCVQAATGKQIFNWTMTGQDIRIDNVYELTSSAGFALRGVNSAVVNCYTAGNITAANCNNAIISRNSCNGISIDSSTNYLIEGNNCGALGTITEAGPNGLIRGNIPDFNNDDYITLVQVAAQGGIVTYAAIGITGLTQFNCCVLQVVFDIYNDGSVWSSYGKGILITPNPASDSDVSYLMTATGIEMNCSVANSAILRIRKTKNVTIPH